MANEYNGDGSILLVDYTDGTLGLNFESSVGGTISVKDLSGDTFTLLESFSYNKPIELQTSGNFGVETSIEYDYIYSGNIIVEVSNSFYYFNALNTFTEEAQITGTFSGTSESYMEFSPEDISEISLSGYSLSEYGATEIHKYVDPDCTGDSNGNSWATAYRSLSVALNLDVNLVAAQNIYVIHCKSSNGTVDNIPATIDGWTTSSSYYLKIIGEEGYRHFGVWSSSKYRLYTANATALTIKDDYVRIDGLQIGTSSGNSNGQNVIDINTISSSSDIRISNSIIRGHNSSVYSQYGIKVDDTDCVFKIWNTLIYNISNQSFSESTACLYLNCAAGSYVENVTTSGGYRAIRCVVASSVTIKNTISIDSEVDGFYGTFNTNSDYNVSDISSDAPGIHSLNGAEPSFVNKSIGDFHLNTGDTIARNKATTSVYSIYTTDFEEQPRGDTWDIGADEYSPINSFAGNGVISLSGTGITETIYNYIFNGSGNLLAEDLSLEEANFTTNYYSGSGSIYLNGASENIPYVVHEIEEPIDIVLDGTSESEQSSYEYTYTFENQVINTSGTFSINIDYSNFTGEIELEASGIATYNYVGPAEYIGNGAVNFSGTSISLYTRNFVKESVGNIITSGTSNNDIEINRIFVGSVLTSGSSLSTIGNIYSGNGSVSLFGTSTSIKGLEFDGSGNIISSGIGDYSVDFSYNATGTITTSGTFNKTTTNNYTYASTGTINTTGTSASNTSSNYTYGISYTTLLTSGIAATEIGSRGYLYSTTGTIITSGLDDWTYYFEGQYDVNARGTITARGRANSLYNPDFIYSQTGNVLTSGTANKILGYNKASTGTINTSGIANNTYTRNFSYSSTGTITTSGTSNTIRAEYYVPTISGTIELSGTSGIIYSKVFDTYIFRGTIVSSGISATEAFNNFSYNGSGTITLSGETTQVVDVVYSGAGNIITSGSYEVIYGIERTSTGTLALTGTSASTFTRNFEITQDGTVSVNGTSSSIESNDYSCSSVGEIDLNGIFQSTFTRDFYKTSFGTLTLNGTAQKTIGFFQNGNGNINSSGRSSTEYFVRRTYLPNGTARLNSFTAYYPINYHYITNLTGDITLSSETIKSFMPVITNQIEFEDAEETELFSYY